MFGVKHGTSTHRFWPVRCLLLPCPSAHQRALGWEERLVYRRKIGLWGALSPCHLHEGTGQRGFLGRRAPKAPPTLVYLRGSRIPVWAKWSEKALSSLRAVSSASPSLGPHRSLGRGCQGYPEPHWPCSPQHWAAPCLLWSEENGRPWLRGGGLRGLQSSPTQQGLQGEEMRSETPSRKPGRLLGCRNLPSCFLSLSEGGKSFPDLLLFPEARLNLDIKMIITAQAGFSPGNHQSTQQPCKMDSMIPTFQRRKQGLREVKRPAQSHTVSRETEVPLGAAERAELESSEASGRGCT